MYAVVPVTLISNANFKQLLRQIFSAVTAHVTNTDHHVTLLNTRAIRRKELYIEIKMATFRGKTAADDLKMEDIKKSQQ